MLVITSYGSYWNIWKDDCVFVIATSYTCATDSASMKNSPNVTVRVNIWVTTASNAQMTEVRNSKLLLPLEFSEIVLSIQIETHSTLEKNKIMK